MSPLAYPGRVEPSSGKDPVEQPLEHANIARADNFDLVAHLLLEGCDRRPVKPDATRQQRTAN